MAKKPGGKTSELLAARAPGESFTKAEEEAISEFSVRAKLGLVSVTSQKAVRKHVTKRQQQEFY